MRFGTTFRAENKDDLIDQVKASEEITLEEDQKIAVEACISNLATAFGDGDYILNINAMTDEEGVIGDTVSINLAYNQPSLENEVR